MQKAKAKVEKENQKVAKEKVEVKAKVEKENLAKAVEAKATFRLTTSPKTPTSQMIFPVQRKKTGV